MKTETLLKDPVYQLNLLLWMAKEQPDVYYRVRPFFYELGFKVEFIETHFAFPDMTMQAIQKLKLDIGIKPEPDLILGRKSDNKALYFEAKANSFGSTSTNCHQARAHLLASGPAFGEVYPTYPACLLCYVVPGDTCAPMAECLAVLTDELSKGGLVPGVSSCHGLSIRDDKVFYSWDVAFCRHVGTGERDVSILNDVQEDTDPAPLLLVYSDEDCPRSDELKDYYRRAVIDQVRVCLLCDLHASPAQLDYQIMVDDVLMRTTDGVFEYLGRERQKGLRRLVIDNVFKKIAYEWQDKHKGIALIDHELTIVWSTVREKDDFLDWLEDKRTLLPTTKPPSEQLDLFRQPGAGTNGV
jgi:hypothetical protein